MKKFFMILFVALFIAIIGGVIFLMTFDVDKYRSQIVSHIENAIKKPVRLEKIKLGWQSGIALELQGFAILKSEQTSEKLVEIQSAKAVLKLAPLLSRQIQVATVYLNHPMVRLIKKPDGTFEGLEPAPSQPGQAQGQTASTPEVAASLSFLVKEIKIQNGEVFFRDASGKEPMDVNLRKIDVTLENVALDEPIDFKVKVAVLSGDQNLDAKGKLTITPQTRTNTVSGVHAELQLASMDSQEIVKVSPSLKTSGVIFPLDGILTVDADSLKIDDKGLKNDGVRIRFDRGKIRLESLKGPVENISLEALVTTDRVKVQQFSASIAGGKVAGQGSVNMTDPKSPVTGFDVKADKLLIEELVPDFQAGPQVRGLLSVVAKGNLTGQTSDEIQRTITADGTVTMDQGVITNMNVLRDVFQKLSVIPGLVEKLLARLPKNYQEKLKVEDTILKTIQLPFLVQNGVVRLPRLDVATDSFQVAGSGTYALSQGAVAGNAMLSIEPDLSGAMIRSVEELQYLTNGKKEIQIPLTIQGHIPKVAVVPDLQSVATKFATQKAKEMVGGYLEKALGGKETPKETGAPSASSGSVTGKTQSKTGALGDLLRQAAVGTGTE